ncbi:uncharacterized protein C8Q71DRAFT_543228 [Rhodofomes roseus]|uniref:Uncharacterized protein n=1 Tax=Rhodofomes roseus TaxID=34475 RepID=A0ABQ8KKN7_9APHY|nr:uncharacterized protein C8Q71DRAFT_543228 [Rhodofomes roseus]KAH9838718.1 hypothetical protein C8Q71DRAFT_543228 [Rhodofomes roseus]
MESERLLYREVSVKRVPHIRSLHRALVNSPRRSSLVNIFRAIDNGFFDSVLPLLKEILLAFTQLEHLELTLNLPSQFPEGIDTILAQCTFELKSFASHAFYNKNVLTFLERQSRLETLRTTGYPPPDWSIPSDTLPRLKYVEAYSQFFVHAIRAPHAITHLDLSLFYGDPMEFGKILRVVRHQLISLKYNLHFGPHPPVWLLTDNIMNGVSMPNLRYLEIKDDGMRNPGNLEYTDDNLAHMERPNTALDTLVWSARFMSQHNFGPPTPQSRLAFVRSRAKQLLEIYGVLRRFFYVERIVGDRQHTQETCVVLFKLGSDGRFMEETTEVNGLPVWSDI